MRVSVFVAVAMLRERQKESNFVTETEKCMGPNWITRVLLCNAEEAESQVWSKYKLKNEAGYLSESCVSYASVRPCCGWSAAYFPSFSVSAKHFSIPGLLDVSPG